ncbi:MAG TPA: MFS transporter [Bacillales bacterium]|nr:MFS transporter [Bacillales bacterium]
MNVQTSVSDRGNQVLSRLERIPVWSLPRVIMVVIGIGFLFTFYDIFDINVSFIQTSEAIIPGATAETAGNYIGLPVLMNLVGYVVGTLILSPIADRIGRRNMLLITMLITGLGSLYTAFTYDYTNFIIARAITGVGIGADLAVVNTYINEMAPRQSRAKYTAMIFIMSGLGALLGIWLGLWLTTPATPFPLGLPFALASESFDYGWRIMYVVGAVLALIGIIMRVRLPESPRWLVTAGREDEADQVVKNMEQLASERTTLPGVETVQFTTDQHSFPYRTIFSNKTYLTRTILLLFVWLLSYVTVYSFSAGMTTLLVGLHYKPPEAGLIVAFGVFGMVISAIVSYYIGEKLERKWWIIISAILTLIGGVIVALAGVNLGMAVFGAIIVFFGFNLYVPMTYTWTTENFPTRARTSGFALVDGLGHIGGGIGLLAIAPLIPALGVLKGFLLIGLFLLVASIIALFGVRTRDKMLE